MDQLQGQASAAPDPRVDELQRVVGEMRSATVPHLPTAAATDPRVEALQNDLRSTAAEAETLRQSFGFLVQQQQELNNIVRTLAATLAAAQPLPPTTTAVLPQPPATQPAQEANRQISAAPARSGPRRTARRDNDDDDADTVATRSSRRSHHSRSGSDSSDSSDNGSSNSTTSSSDTELDVWDSRTYLKGNCTEHDIVSDLRSTIELTRKSSDWLQRHYRNATRALHVYVASNTEARSALRKSLQDHLDSLRDTFMHECGVSPAEVHRRVRKLRDSNKRTPKPKLVSRAFDELLAEKARKPQAKKGRRSRSNNRGGSQAPAAGEQQPRDNKPPAGNGQRGAPAKQ